MPEGRQTILSAEMLAEHEYRNASSFALGPILLQYWQAVVRWRLVIIGIIGTCLVASVLVTLLMAPLYTAQTQIEVSREQKNITNVEGLDSRREGLDEAFHQFSLGDFSLRSK